MGREGGDAYLEVMVSDYSVSTGHTFSCPK